MRFPWCGPTCWIVVDKFLRLNGPLENKPFGGIQMIFIGDLYQFVAGGNER